MFKYLRPKEQKYAFIPDVEHPETNRYGTSIETVPEGHELRGQSLNINGDSAIGDNPNRYKQHGASGLVHQARGKESNRKVDPALKEAILKRYEERYEGFGPTFAMEKLREEQYSIHAETLRIWLMEAGLWQRHRKRKKRMMFHSLPGQNVPLFGATHVQKIR